MTPKPTKTIFITSFHVLVSRNILSSPFLALLEKAGWRVVVIMPQKKQEYFEREFGGANVLIEGVENRLNRLDGFFRDLALAAIKTKSLRLMRQRGMGIERPLMQKLLFFAPAIRPLIPFLYRLIMPAHSFHDLFLKYKPDLIFSTDVFSSNDCRLMREAVVHGVPTLGMIRSWDNLTTKGGFRVISERLVAHNEIASDEAAKFHGINPAIITKIGVPHYDRYLQGATVPRAEFLESLGLSTDGRYIVYAPIGDRIMKVGERVQQSTFDKDAIEALDKTLPTGIALIVRLPPTDTVTVGRSLFSPRVIFQEPGVRFGEGVTAVRGSEMSRADDNLLLNTLYHASLLINPFSSLCLDALVLDRPVVVPHFDFHPVSFVQSIKRLQEFEHFRPIMESPGVKVVNSAKELESAICDYLANSVLDHEARRFLAEKECFKLDGRSSERLFEVARRLAENK